MDLKCHMGKIYLIIFAFPYSLNYQLRTTGYAFQFISGFEEESSLSVQLMHVYHSCWIDYDCKYVAKVKGTGEYVMLKSLEGDEKVNHGGIWKKRVEDVDECASNPCQNGGSCVNRLGAFSCICTSRYTGALCQEQQWEMSCIYQSNNGRLFQTATREECLSACIAKKSEGAVAAAYIDDRDCLCSTSTIKMVISRSSYCILL